jgi:hypothetical protein
MSQEICILGAGTYGSYLANALAHQWPDAQIRLVEVGNGQTKSEQEIGYFSSLRAGAYKAASDGRFFGHGGTSAKWGGQLLFFSQNDFANCPEMEQVVEANLAYAPKVLGRFFARPPSLAEHVLPGKKLFVRQGIWLKFNQRNLFQLFRLNQHPRVKLVENVRLLRLEVADGQVRAAVVRKDTGEQVPITADRFYLTCGALESMRILGESKLVDLSTCTKGFADHISVRCFRVSAPPIIAGHDFTFKFLNGSMITTRIIGELEGVSFYAHPIYNEEFTFFQFLKQLIYKNQFSPKQLFKALAQSLAIIPFAAQYLFLRKLYRFGPWSINIDIELDPNDNALHQANTTDSYGVPGLDIGFQVPEQTMEKLERAKDEIRNLLLASGLKFEELHTGGDGAKPEDTYHPYNLYAGLGQVDFERLYHPLPNLFVFHTGILKRAGGINPTAALFCLIEQHLAQTTR